MEDWKPKPVDWQEFRKSLLSQLPFNDKELSVKEIGNFVQKTLKQYLPSSVLNISGMEPFGLSALDYDVFETHRSIFVRCRLPANASAKDIRFFASKRKLKIEYSGKAEEITLPSDVNTSRTIARTHNGVLEIRMPKINQAEPFREIFIRDGD